MSEDATLAALIVRNIGDIEAAMSLAQGEIDDQFNKELFQAVEAESAAAWMVKCDEDDENVRLTRQEWLAVEDEDEDEEFWLLFGELPGTNDDTEYTWIAAATGSGPNGAALALIFQQETITPARFKKLLNSKPELVDRLRKHNFERDESGKMLFRPVLIEREELACAFEADDFDAALTPVRLAVNDAKAAMEDLTELVTLIRAEQNT